MRECGMLLPVASLPSKYGIGAFSKEAYEFVDQLKRAGQTYWQILPLGPTGYGDSPYQSFSAFAGNPYFIDLTELVKEGLLTEEECEASDFGSDLRYIDYEKLYYNRFPLLKKAFVRWKTQGHTSKEAMEALEEETGLYCFYMAIKDYFEGKSWIYWDEEFRLRTSQAISRYEEELKEEIGLYAFLQMKFTEQWEKLKSYAADNGIRIIGDMPIYVAFDSADTWSHPELFQFDDENNPMAVAGCPPDGFSPTGQLWGNPLYRWGYHKETGYEWWKKRMEYSFHLYDVVRVDHFRGFDEYYSIPAGSENAISGTWEKGPGIDLFYEMKKTFGDLDIIAEDLGFLTPSVRSLLKETGYPGMKVLEFAFNSWEESDYLPHNHTENSVVYTGTHDNDTLKSWYHGLSKEDRTFADNYLNTNDSSDEQISWNYIRVALQSVARLAIIPVQDYLGLGCEARINEPSTLGKNWRFRLLPGELTEEVLNRCRELTFLYGRGRD
jgi:4-alpha-glucanotransferase